MITNKQQRCQRVFCSLLLGSLIVLQFACSTNNDPSLQYDAESTLNPAGPTVPNDDSLAPPDPNVSSSWFTNGGVEDGVSPWYAQGEGVTLTQSDLQQHSGQYSLLVEGRTEEWNAPVMPLLSTLPTGETYEARVWVKLAEGESPATIKLSMKVDVAGEDVTYPQIDEAEVSADAWTQLSGTFTHNPAGEVNELTLYVQSSNVAARYYVDDLSLESQGNLITNGGLESGLTPWRYQGPGVMITQASEQARTGDYSLLVSGRSDTWNAPIMDLPPLTDGRAYLASVWVRLAPGTADSNLKFTLKRKAAGQEESEAEYIPLGADLVSDDNWVQLTGIFTHTVGVTLDQLYVFIESDSAGSSASFYVDDLEVGITTADLVVNGDLESSLSGWTPFGANVLLQRTDADAYSGDFSLHISNRDQSWQGVSFSFAPLTEGELYNFSCWVKMAPDHSDADVALTIKIVDDGGENYLQLNAAPVTAESWVQLSGLYQHAPEGEVTELTTSVSASDATAEFLIDACAVMIN